MVDARMASKKLCMGYGCGIKGLHTLDLIRNRTLAPGKWREYLYITCSPSANLHIDHAPTPKTQTLNGPNTRSPIPKHLIPKHPRPRDPRLRDQYPETQYSGPYPRRRANRWIGELATDVWIST